MSTEREKSKQRHTRLVQAVRDGDDKLAEKLRKEIDAAPPSELSVEMKDSMRNGPRHTCCPACLGR